jgi:hypothetical protein
MYMNTLRGVPLDGQSTGTIENSQQVETGLTFSLTTIQKTNSQSTMCWGIREISVCSLCRVRTPVDEIQWQGCHLEASEVDSYPICSEPIITEEVKRSDCQICLTEADDGHDTDDEHPEPSDHPGFPLPKSEVNVSHVRLPRPTTYETIQHVENLAGSANQLHSYEQAMNESPSAPDYTLIRVRDEAVHRSVITDRVFAVTVRRFEGLKLVALNRRYDIDDLQGRIPSHLVPILDLARRTIDSFLSEQEEIVSRTVSLQEHLESVEKAISFEGSHHPSPAEMLLLKHQQQSIIRELEEKFINNFSMTKPVDWDARRAVVGACP